MGSATRMFASRLRRHTRESIENRNTALQIVNPENDVIKVDSAGPRLLSQGDCRTHQQKQLRRAGERFIP